MKYNQPYGVSDPNAPYVNGNPSTGTMGSIPPAASIEHPQREIVNFETDSGMTPTDADLRQLSKSVQSGKVNYCVDTGSQNFISITPTPPIAAYQAGQRFVIKAGNPNSGITKINVSGLGFVPLVHGDLTELGAWEYAANQLIEVCCDGNGHFQMMTGVGTGVPIMLTAPANLYVNSAIGSDTNYDGTQASVSGTKGPFATLQHALAVMATYNLSGHAFHIWMADGVYSTTTLYDAPIPNGSGTVAIHGNTTVHDAVKFLNIGAGTAFRVYGGAYRVEGVYFGATAPDATSGDGAGCIWVFGSGSLSLYWTAFGPSPGPQILCGPGGTVSIFNHIYIYGGASAHMQASGNGVIAFYTSPYPDLTFYTNAAFGTAFACAFTGSEVNVQYSSINFIGGVTATGPRYLATGNGVIDSGGRGVNFLPGSTPGFLASGGQYL